VGRKKMKTLNMLPNLTVVDAVDVIFNLDFNRPFAEQIQAYFEGIGDTRGFTHVSLVGQATAAILALPVMEMLGGLPQVALVPFKAREVAAWLDTRTFRHDVCRAMRRTEDVGMSAPDGYTVIDGAGRGLTTEQLTKLAEQLNCEVGQIRVFSTNPGQVELVNLGGEAGRQVAEGIKSAMIEAGFPVNEPAAGTSSLIFLPHGAGIVGTVQALAIHGFTGAWPRTVRIAGSPAEGFHVREVVDPQAMRQWAIGLADRLEKVGAPVLISRDALTALIEAAAIVHASRVSEKASALFDDDLRQAIDEANAALR
jgi:ribosomal protein L12E/L44/L45/RPP1/RPP2